jgi:transcription initiation factor IIE alpha subunit
MTQEDLRDKGDPFACNNCGAKPTAEDVVRLNGNCDVCGDEIIACTIDTAKLILNLR